MGALCATLCACNSGGAQPFGANASLPEVRALVAPASGDHGYETLHAFAGGRGDGGYPNAGLTAAGSTLYGTTAGGGPYGEGSVFRSSTTGNEIALYYFGYNSSYEDGANPDAPVTVSNGFIYGTTESGGYDNDGTVFEIGSNGRERVLHEFYSYYGPDGANPYGGLLLVGDTFYGTTYAGGVYGNGTVFQMGPTGGESLLYSFGAASGDGANPMASLIDVDGTLYGTTYGGGTYGDGTVFSLTTSGTESVLHSFGVAGDGANPRAALVAIGKWLYGTTVAGGTSNEGTVFRISTDGREKVLHSFTGPPDGVGPYAPLVSVDRVLYGTTYDGGSGGCASWDGCGAIFRITTSGRESIVYSFTSNPDGAHPWGGVVKGPGGLYGTASLGGTGVGTIFRIAR
ncbi:MAG TPA: choice-of-anchor tandem repeat GloVer-containing protein [Candidatus Cybelea sp.]|nr:choice-of-anchor tandem repeat GloVer-containing protein [Candidatus Cybelea sp.]